MTPTRGIRTCVGASTLAAVLFPACDGGEDVRAGTRERSEHLEHRQGATSGNAEIETGDDGSETGGSTGEDPEHGPSDASRDMASLETVYSRSWSVDNAGVSSDVSIDGDLDLETWQKVVRPWTHAGDPWIYIEEEGITVSATGETSNWYRVRRLENTTPLLDAPDPPAPPELRATLVGALDTASPDTAFQINLKLRNYPSWDIPLVPRERVLTPAERELAMAQRAAALVEREAAFDLQAQPVAAAATALGAEIVDRVWTSGWLVVRANRDTIENLADRTDLQTIELDHVAMQPLSEDLELIRSRASADVESFWDVGHYAQTTNGRVMRAAVLEEWHINDDVCFLDDNGGCVPSRLKKRFECGFGCALRSSTQYDWMTSGQDLLHGTGVVSLIAADYTQNQADGHDVCDPACTGAGACTHQAVFESQSSAPAKEANIDYYDMLGSSSQTIHSYAVKCAQGIGTNCTEADAINNSNAWNTSSDLCNADSSSLLEDEYENAFDDGVLVVSGAGNQGTTGSSCNLVAPADTPKILTINGIDLSSDDYATAPIHDVEAAIGGGSIQVPNGTNRAGALAFVDLAAPSGGIGHGTVSTSADPVGCVLTSTFIEGTSAATPIATGAALTLKAQLLSAGQTGVDYPGRLHATMLLMGDRMKTGGGYKGTGTDDRFGFGRLKMRLVESGSPSSSPGAIERSTMTFVSGTADLKYIAFGGNPVPSGAELLKCVLLQDEDMSGSGRDNISRFKLKVIVRGEKSGGGCAVDQGTVHFTKTNSDYDHKKMVAYTDSTKNIENRCIQVKIDKVSLSSANVTTVHAVCGYFSEVDNVPN